MIVTKDELEDKSNDDKKYNPNSRLKLFWKNNHPADLNKTITDQVGKTYTLCYK